MSTNVQVFAGDVIEIVKVALNTIAAERLVKIDEWIDKALQETEAVFYFDLFGVRRKYKTREAAVAAMKAPFQNWEGVFCHGNSYYAHYSRYYKRDDERRLISLSNMAQSSIDDTLWLDANDHALIRSYAAGYLWLAGKEAA